MVSTWLLYFKLNDSIENYIVFKVIWFHFRMTSLQKNWLHLIKSEFLSEISFCTFDTYVSNNCIDICVKNCVYTRIYCIRQYILKQIFSNNIQLKIFCSPLSFLFLFVSYLFYRNTVSRQLFHSYTCNLIPIYALLILSYASLSKCTNIS